MYKKWRWRIFVMTLGAFASALLSLLFRDDSIAQMVLAVLALVILVIAGILDCIKCRCPSCGRYIPERRFPFSAYENCPYCGADLDSWEYK